MVVISWSDHRGNWRDAGFSNDTPPKISKACHRVTVVGAERSIQLSYNRTYWDPQFCGNNRYYTTTCAGLQDVGESFSRIPF